MQLNESQLACNYNYASVFVGKVILTSATTLSGEHEKIN
jgi:hypothetical protein